ncbi:MAG: CDP-alcohol phosphatidyltransferase family protein [Candidatus Acidiferrales bacterium]
MMALIDRIARPFRWLLDRIAAGIAATGIHPTLLIWASVFFYFWAGLLFAVGRFSAAGAWMLVAGFCDLLDERVAHHQNRGMIFAIFLDSILDRYADLILFVALLVYYARVNRFVDCVVVGFAMAGAVLVSYAESRAASLIENARVGFWERPERIVLMVIAAFANRMPVALWILAIGSNITVVHRMLHTWQLTEGKRRGQTIPETSATASAEVSKAQVLTRGAAGGR